MIRKDTKCSFCGFEKEIWFDKIDHLPEGCKNPDKPNCPGVMENSFRTAPWVSQQAMPTRKPMDGVTYNVSGKK